MRYNQEPKGPSGKLVASFRQLHSNGCIQTGPEYDYDKAYPNFFIMFKGLMAATDDNMCDGCPEYKGGTCKAFLMFHTASPRKSHSVRASSPSLETSKHAGKTVAQIAKELSISKNEVRRRKTAGTL